MTLIEHILFFVACGLAGYLIGFAKGVRDARSQVHFQVFADGVQTGVKETVTQMNVKVGILEGQNRSLRERLGENQ